jgi:hypothetical protein
MSDVRCQLMNSRTGQVIGDAEHGQIYWEGDTRSVLPKLSTPFTRGTLFEISEGWKRFRVDPDLTLVMPDGQWWSFGR